jgi:EAL domain-containing protein (putative c-di-GMP-specific phosphodiesterase class I)
VVNSIISLAESLGLQTIGEGVENKAQVEWLTAHGCTTIQGYYYHKPMPGEKISELMQKKKFSELPSPSLRQSLPRSIK